mgnify:CR=1 FL=1
MSQPDLSFLMNAEPGSGDSPVPVERRRADRPKGAVAALIAELRAYQAELESQNKVLRYSQTVAESASERFETLFASVPLALMVVDEYDMVVQANSMAHRSFQPTERDRPLTALMPFVSDTDAPRVQEAFAQARTQGHSEVTEVVFTIAPHTRITGDLHIARIEDHQGDGPMQLQFLCAVIDQGPLLAERHALQQSAQALQQRNEQLHASEKRLEAVINSALDAIICVDQNGLITVFNPTAAALFQCSAQDALGSPLERFLPAAAQALAFAPPHLSIYHLTIEPNTAFAVRPPRNLPDDDLAYDMLDAITRATHHTGLERYEVSAYARPGHACVHNRNYWEYGDYLGIGAGAHSKLSFPHRIVRQVRLRDPRRYMQQALAGQALAQEHDVPHADLAFEYMLNALRLRQGFALADFTARTGLAAGSIEPALRQAEEKSWIERDLRCVRPTVRGFDFLSDLQALFLPAHG